MLTPSATALPQPRRVQPSLSKRGLRRFPPKSAEPVPTTTTLPSPALLGRDSPATASYFADTTDSTSSASPHQLLLFSTVLVCDRSQPLARFSRLFRAQPRRRNKRLATGLPRFISTGGATPHQHNKLSVLALHRFYFTPRLLGRPSQPTTRPTLRTIFGAKITRPAASHTTPGQPETHSTSAPMKSSTTTTRAQASPVTSCPIRASSRDRCAWATASSYPGSGHTTPPRCFRRLSAWLLTPTSTHTTRGQLRNDPGGTSTYFMPSPQLKLSLLTPSPTRRPSRHHRSAGMLLRAPSSPAFYVHALTSTTGAEHWPLPACAAISSSGSTCLPPTRGAQPLLTDSGHISTVDT
jgi:hypothetical protein